MKKIIAFSIFNFLFSISIFSQIIIDNNAPYNNPNWLIDNVLLGGGVTAFNYSYQGASGQIGWFNAVNTSLGLDSGIILCTGDIYSVDPVNTGPAVVMPVPAIIDPDLLTVANSVPPLLPAPHTNSFTVGSVNDIAILEFDFIPTSDSIEFRYVFGSEEYHTYENTVYNDVFGFFLSGPGITGPYSSPPNHPGGSINLAIVPNSTPPLPITISSVNSVTPINQQYFVDNQNGLDTIASADGLTTVLTAKALVQCADTFHIRLAIADGTDGILDSYVWLEAGSFSSPVLNVVDDLGIDSTVMSIPCNSTITLMADGGVGATYQWLDSNGVVISSDSFITVGPGTYLVEASSFGCPVTSDTLTVVSDDAPYFNLGSDTIIACNTKLLVQPQVLGGTGLYTYLWNHLDSLNSNIDSSTNSSINAGQGIYSLLVNDGTGCYFLDTITITESSPPSAIISGGGTVCDNNEMLSVSIDFTGSQKPWMVVYSNQNNTDTVENLFNNNFTFLTKEPGEYTILNAADNNGCIAEYSGSANIIVNELPVPIISPSDTVLYIGDEVFLETTLEYNDYYWYNAEIINSDTISTSKSIMIDNPGGTYYVVVTDVNGCTDTSEVVSVTFYPRTQIFVPNVFTPNGDGWNNLFVVKGEYIDDFYIKIFNRWGENIFESNSINKSWDGTVNGIRVPEGTYYYSLFVIGFDGTEFIKNGTIHLTY